MFSNTISASFGLFALAYKSMNSNASATRRTFSTTALNTATKVAKLADVKVVPNDKLYISEPHPTMFGNPPNPTNEPSWTHPNWLQSRFHFSFAEYNNFDNSNFGILRVMNDDLVQPHRMFGSHSHRNMEILTYVVNGELSHKDSMGTSESLGRGSIQFMTAGTGVVHSEANDGDTPLRFVQTWILPSQHGLKPKYGSYTGNPDLRRNQLQHLVSSVDNQAVNTPVEVNQDVDAFASELELHHKVTHDLGDDRQAYLLCIEGSVSINGKKLCKYDACEVSGGGNMEIEATETEDTEHGSVAHILMFTMKAVPDSGRTDL